MDNGEASGIVAENAQLKQTLAEDDNSGLLREAERIQAQWSLESRQCQEKYPGFDFGQEFHSPETGEMYQALLMNGADVRTAYELVHRDDLLAGIRSADEPPRTTDPTKLTKQDRDNLANRAMSGERIVLDPIAAEQDVEIYDVTKLTKDDRRILGNRAMRGERIQIGPGGEKHPGRETKTDPAKLSRADRDELARRALQYDERIELRR